MLSAPGLHLLKDEVELEDHKGRQGTAQFVALQTNTKGSTLSDLDKLLTPSRAQELKNNRSTMANPRSVAASVLRRMLSESVLVFCRCETG